MLCTKPHTPSELGQCAFFSYFLATGEICCCFCCKQAHGGHWEHSRLQANLPHCSLWYSIQITILKRFSLNCRTSPVFQKKPQETMSSNQLGYRLKYLKYIAEERGCWRELGFLHPIYICFIYRLTDREAMGIPDSSTGPMPSYFTQRFSFLRPSFVQVADQPGCAVPLTAGRAGEPAGWGAGAVCDVSGLISLAGQVGYQLFAANRYGQCIVSQLCRR